MPRSDWCRRSLDAKQAARLVWRHELAAHGRSCDLVVRKAPSASKEGKSSLATFSEQGFGVAWRGGKGAANRSAIAVPRDRLISFSDHKLTKPHQPLDVIG